MENFQQMIQRLLTRKVVVFVRQSSRAQVRKHTGSYNMQMEQTTDLHAFGFKPEQILTITAMGESGRRGAHRPEFNKLLALIESGEVGMVSARRGDRLGRNKVDNELLIEAAEAHGVVLALGGRLYDPNDPTDRYFLGLQAEYAQLENNGRTKWMVATGFARARELKLRTILPTGLVWGSPDDHTYVERMRSAGLNEWLENLAEHRAVSTHEGRRYYVLPFPDAELALCAHLRLRWLLETRDLDAVVSRINEDAEWPRPRQVPVLRGARFQPDMEVEWREFARTGDLREHLSGWYRSPALFGCYHFTSRARRPAWKRDASAELTPAEKLDCEVRSPDAFPSFASPEDEARVRDILSARKRTDRHGAWRGKRGHALPNVRCAHVGDDGAVCGRKATATYKRNGRFYYKVSCGYGSHQLAVPHHLDACVLEVIQKAFDPAAVEKAVRTLRTTTDDARTHRNVLQNAVRKLEKQVKSCRDKELLAHAAGDRVEEVYWAKQRVELMAELEQRQRELDLATRQEKAVRDTGSTELRKIFAAAEDIPELFHRVADRPKLLHALVALLTRAVHVRRVTAYAVEFGIEFPSGEIVRRIMFTRELDVAQPERLWAARRLDAGATAAQVATELNAAANEQRRYRWDEDRVLTAALLEKATTPATWREGEHRTVEQIAHSMRHPVAEVRAAAVAGRLGPARWEGDGLAFGPTDAELHRDFPDYARRTVACARGWREKEVIPLTEAVADKRATLKRDQFVNVLEHRSALARDASGRCWVWEPLAFASDRDLFLRALPELAPSFVDLDPEYWVVYADALRRLPHVSPPLLYRRVPTVTWRLREDAPQSVYFWVGPRVVEELVKPTLSEAVRALNDPALHPDDFLPLTRLEAVTRSRLGVPTIFALRRAIDQGRLLRIYAKPENRASKEHAYTHLPPHVRDGSDEELWRWVFGSPRR